MNENYIILIDYSNGSVDYREFETYAKAKKYLEKEIEPNKYIQHAQIVKVESRFGWTNPNCSPEEDF